MSQFTFQIPGQPISWNAAYQIRDRETGRRGIFKTSEASTFQDLVAYKAKEKRPSWFVIGKSSRMLVAYDFILAADIDCDNLLKLINDGLAVALGCNDKLFMPVVMSKSIGNERPFTKVTVYDANAWEVQIVPR